MPGIEILGLLEDIARELETFGCACVFEADEVHPRGWVRITEGPPPARVIDYYSCWQCGQPIQVDPANCFGWSHVANQEYPDHGAQPNDPGYVKS